jgi:hypothetical protein
MPRSVISFDYSEANILGWLFSQNQDLPRYQDLVQVASLPTLSQRRQALQHWKLFQGVKNWDENWVTELLNTQYDDLQISLPTRYQLDTHSYLTDFVWLKRWMTRIRYIARTQFLEKQTQPDREFVVELFSKILEEVPIPTDLQSAFLISFEDALKRPLTLVSLEFALDRASLAIQTQHLPHTKSIGICQWIMLQAVLIWVRQYARALSLGVPEPKWSEWFPIEIAPPEFASYETLLDSLWSSLAKSGGSEWVVPVEMLDRAYMITVEPVALETQTKQVLSQFLNQSIYNEDTYLKILQYVFDLQLLIETAAVIVSPNMPDAETVAKITTNYDLE